jgi:uncharacterized protein YgiM (DUF1202 family)
VEHYAKIVLEKASLRSLIEAAERPQGDDAEFIATGVVTASSLNFRTAPSYDAERKSEPLPNGAKLKILKEESGWYQVQVPQTGWVKKEYVRIID